MSEAYTNTPLASISPGMTIESVYYLIEVQEKTARTGKQYCDLKLRDKSGVRIAKMWKEFEGFESRSYVFIRGHVDEYGGAAQMIAKEVVNIEEDEVDINDFMVMVDNIGEYINMFKDYVGQLTDPTIKAFIQTIFTEKFKKMFFDAPASEGARYGAVGGALMQSCRVAAAVEQMAYSYDLDTKSKELLLASSFISNSGKVYAYSTEDHIPMMTLKGSLFGDSAISYQKIIIAVVKLRQDTKKACKLAGVDDKEWKPNEETILHLTHLVLSSRSGNIDPASRGEKMSSVLPQTLESMILSQCFLSDERSALAYDAIKSCELGHSDPKDPFTPYDFATRRRYLKPPIED